jgi:hypothetical protein
LDATREKPGLNPPFSSRSEEKGSRQPPSKESGSGSEGAAIGKALVVLPLPAGTDVSAGPGVGAAPESQERRAERVVPRLAPVPPPTGRESGGIDGRLAPPTAHRLAATVPYCPRCAACQQPSRATHCHCIRCAAPPSDSDAWVRHGFSWRAKRAVDGMEYLYTTISSGPLSFVFGERGRRGIGMCRACCASRGVPGAARHARTWDRGRSATRRARFARSGVKKTLVLGVVELALDLGKTLVLRKMVICLRMDF